MTPQLAAVACGKSAMALRAVGLPLPGEVQLWSVSLDVSESQLAEARRSLSPDEIARAKGYVFECDRAAFIVARGALRDILSRYLGCRPGEVRFEYGPHGKPRLNGPYSTSGLRFNLSHSKDLAVCAVTRGRAVGVDVEWMRPEIDVTGIARSTFSPGENERLQALPRAERLAAFYACWTRKEAYIKARGEGLSYPLDAFEVSLEPGRPATLLRSEEGSSELDRWVLRALNVEPGYAAALAVEGPLTRLLLVS